MEISELLTLLPLVGLANWQTVETLHHGSILEEKKAELQAKGGFLGKLISCPFCMSHWTSFLLSASAIAANAGWDIFSLKNLIYTLLFSLSATRVSNVANDLGKSYWRQGNFQELNSLVADTTKNGDSTG